MIPRNSTSQINKIIQLGDFIKYIIKQHIWFFVIQNR